MKFDLRVLERKMSKRHEFHENPFCDSSALLGVNEFLAMIFMVLGQFNDIWRRSLSNAI
jgi:hypothetical protein